MKVWQSRWVVASSLVVGLGLLVGAATAEAPAKLPGGVSYRLREAGRILDSGERAFSSTGAASEQWKTEAALDAVRQAREKLAEIEKGYGGQYSPTHPDVVAVQGRIQALEARAQGRQEVAQQARVAQQQVAAQAGAASADWVTRLSPYVTPIGRPTHDKTKYLIPSATQEQAEMERRLTVYGQAAADLAAYRQAALGARETEELKEIVAALDQALQDFRKSVQQYGGQDLVEAGRRLDDAERFVKAQEAKVAAQQQPLLLDKLPITQIDDILARAAGLLKKDDVGLLTAQKRLAALKQADGRLRAAWKAGTKMTPDRYAGGDLAALKKAAEGFVLKANPGVRLLKTTIISADWGEENVVEWTDTTQTALRRRNSRSVTAQVAGKKGVDCFLYTVDVSKDRRGDGSWGSLYGHVMYTDPMLEENAR